MLIVDIAYPCINTPGDEEEGEVVLAAEAEDEDVPDEAAVAEWAHLEDPAHSPDDVWKVGACVERAPAGIAGGGVGPQRIPAGTYYCMCEASIHS
jgi:hypothetical protein